MTFTTISVISAVVALALGGGFLFAPSFMLGQWGLAHEAPAVFVSRRIGAIYLGLAVVFALGRGAAESTLRDALCVGLAVALVLLAGTGMAEARAKRVSSGIAVSIVVEVLLAAGFVWVAVP